MTISENVVAINWKPKRWKSFTQIANEIFAILGLFSVRPMELKRPWGGQWMTWQRGMRKCTTNFNRCLRGWSLKDMSTNLMETLLKDMVLPTYRAACRGFGVDVCFNFLEPQLKAEYLIRTETMGVTPKGTSHVWYSMHLSSTRHSTQYLARIGIISDEVFNQLYSESQGSQPYRRERSTEAGLNANTLLHWCNVMTLSPSRSLARKARHNARADKTVLGKETGVLL